jgi:hypothetical protein
MVFPSPYRGMLKSECCARTRVGFVAKEPMHIGVERIDDWGGRSPKISQAACMVTPTYYISKVNPRSLASPICLGKSRPGSED